MNASTQKAPVISGGGTSERIETPHGVDVIGRAR